MPIILSHFKWIFSKKIIAYSSSRALLVYKSFAVTSQWNRSANKLACTSFIWEFTQCFAWEFGQFEKFRISWHSTQQTHRSSFQFLFFKFKWNEMRILIFLSLKFIKIPDFVYSLTSLSTLYLRFNRIKEVQNDIKNLTV